jgi:hypothetical protein
LEDPRRSLKPEMSCLSFGCKGWIHPLAIVSHPQCEVLCVTYLHFKPAPLRVHTGIPDRFIADLISSGTPAIASSPFSIS